MIKVGIVGCGRIAKAHLNALSGMRNKFFVSTVFDTNIEIANSLAREYGVSSVSAHFEEILNDPSINLVSVTVPDGFHYRIVKKLLLAGKNVLVEKPIALSKNEMIDLVNLAKSKDLFLGVVLQKRLFKIFVNIKRLVENGVLGDIFLSSLQQIWYRDDAYFNSSWHGERSIDGGLILNQSTHNIDLLDWIVGPITRVISFGGNLVKNIETEDTVASSYTTENGVGNIMLTISSYPKNFGSLFQIFGTKGRITVGTGKFECLTTEELKQYLYELKYPTISGYGHSIVYSEVFDRLTHGEHTNIEAFNVIHSSLVAFALRKSIEEHKKIEIGGSNEHK